MTVLKLRDFRYWKMGGGDALTEYRSSVCHPKKGVHFPFNSSAEKRIQRVNMTPWDFHRISESVIGKINVCVSHKVFLCTYTVPGFISTNAESLQNNYAPLQLTRLWIGISFSQQFVVERQWSCKTWIMQCFKCFTSNGEEFVNTLIKNLSNILIYWLNVIELKGKSMETWSYNKCFRV